MGLDGVEHLLSRVTARCLLDHLCQVGQLLNGISDLLREAEYKHPYQEKQEYAAREDNGDQMIELGRYVTLQEGGIVVRGLEGLVILVGHFLEDQNHEVELNLLSGRSVYWSHLQYPTRSIECAIATYSERNVSYIVICSV